MKPYDENDMSLDHKSNLYVDLRGDPLTGKVIFETGEHQYVVNGQLHREDGPASIGRHSGPGWYLKDIQYEFEEYIIEAGWTDEQIVEYKLTHGT